MPASKMQGAGFLVSGNIAAVGNNNGGVLWTGLGYTELINIALIGQLNQVIPVISGNSVLNSSTLSPADAYVIDNKFDDGEAFQGNIRAADSRNGSLCGIYLLTALIMLSMFIKVAIITEYCIVGMVLR